MITQTEQNEDTLKYQLSKTLVGRVLWSVLVKRRRLISADAINAMKGVKPTAQLLGLENIPDDSAFLIACNHYNRPGFQAWWIGLAVSAAVASRRSLEADKEIHWIMTAAWTFPESVWKQRLLTPVTKWGFARLADVYRFIPMPPMPPRPEEVAERAAAVLRTVRLARRIAAHGGMIGLAPEGHDIPGKIGKPPEGVGEFIALLVQAGMLVLPVGICEHENRLRVRFGKPFVPGIPDSRAERDAAVSSRVMQEIFALLP